LRVARAPARSRAIWRESRHAEGGDHDALAPAGASSAPILAGAAV
jgi:hypothetical protein